MKRISLVVLALVLSSCAGSNQVFYNFKPNVPKTVTVGSVMCEWDLDSHNWAGRLMNEQKAMLTLSGIEGTTLFIDYAEQYTTNTPPMTVQQMRYDIAKDSVVVYKGNYIRILSASGSTVRFMVTEAPAFHVPGGVSIQ